MKLSDLSALVEDATAKCIALNIDPKQVEVVSVDYNTSMPVKHAEFDLQLGVFKLNVNS